MSTRNISSRPYAITCNRACFADGRAIKRQDFRLYKHRRRFDCAHCLAHHAICQWQSRHLERKVRVPVLITPSDWHQTAENSDQRRQAKPPAQKHLKSTDKLLVILGCRYRAHPLGNAKLCGFTKPRTTPAWANTGYSYCDATYDVS